MGKEDQKSKEPEEERKEEATESEKEPEESKDTKDVEKEKVAESWDPKTALGRDVKQGKVTDIFEILDSTARIHEADIVDMLVPDLETDLLLVGQSKGKFGGGKRRVFKQTQKKTREGNKPKFATIAVVGNHNGLVGVGHGKSKETVPAREKALRNAKLNIMKIRRGCGSWQCGCKNPHSIPYKISGKIGSVEIDVFPAPKGTGLRVESECQKILNMAGIKDAWSRTRGRTRTKINLIYACIKALQQLMDMKITENVVPELGMVEGAQAEGAEGADDAE